MSRNSCTPEVFVRTWETSASIAECAATLGMRQDACRSRANDYRHRGIPLKRYPFRPLPPPDVKALTELVAEIHAAATAAATATATHRKPPQLAVDARQLAVDARQLAGSREPKVIRIGRSGK